MELIIKSLDGLNNAVLELIDFAGAKKKLMFYGEIGAGKTTFIQEFCKYFKVKEPVTSPTFSLVNEYSSQPQIDQDVFHIHHMDLYRLKNLQEAIDIGIEDYLYDDSYCLIEWPEIIEPILPDDIVKIYIEILDNSSRKMIFL